MFHIDILHHDGKSSPSVAILNLKCVQMRYGLGLCPNAAGRAYSAPPDPLAEFGGEGMGLGMKA